MERKKIYIQLVDPKLHATHAQPTTDILKAMEKAEKKGEEYPRIFAPLPKPGEPGGLVFDPAKGVGIPLQTLIPKEFLENAQKQGFDIVILPPEGNFSLGFAPDVAEKVKKAEKRKRTQLIHTTKMREQKYKKYNKK